MRQRLPVSGTLRSPATIPPVAYVDAGGNGLSARALLDSGPTAPDPAAEPTSTWPGGVFICLLGGFRILKGGAPVPLRANGRAETVLATLAFHREEGVDRDTLVEAVWPGTSGEHGVQSLNTLMYWLRQRLGDAVRDGLPVLRRGGRYRLNSEGGVAVDVGEFDRHSDEGDRLSRAGDGNGAISWYESALDLYAGDMALSSEIGHVVERERLRAQYLSLRARVADHHYGAGRYAEALASALALLAVDPCREDAHRTVMRCYVRLGQRAQAVRQYETCRRVLRLEFDGPPEKATTELFELVRLAPEAV